MQIIEGWHDLDPNPCVVTQTLLEEEKTKNKLGLSNAMPGSFEPAN